MAAGPSESCPPEVGSRVRFERGVAAAIYIYASHIYMHELGGAGSRLAAGPSESRPPKGGARVRFERGVAAAIYIYALHIYMYEHGRRRQPDGCWP